MAKKPLSESAAPKKQPIRKNDSHVSDGELTDDKLDQVAGGDSVSGNSTGRRAYKPA